MAAELTLQVVPFPCDTNPSGDVFGGWIMSHVDVAGAVLALREAQGRVVTASVSSLHFHKPVFVGDLVKFYAEVTKIGTTSVTVHVDVFVDRDRHQNGDPIKVTEADLVYVKIDHNRRPVDLKLDPK